MPWKNLGKFKLKRNLWLFSESVEGEIFRIRHIFIGDLPKDPLRAVIAQGFFDDDGNPNKFSPKIFTYGEELQVFTFYFPEGLNTHSIIVKRLDQNLIDWTVELEVFYSEDPQQNYQNYIVNRFGKTATNYFSQTLINNMALYPRLYSGSLDVESDDIKLVAGQIKKIVDKNLSRTGLKVITTGHAVLLATGFDADGKPTAILDKVPPNYNYEKEASSAGIYQGEVWALCEEETYITAIEYSAK